MKKTTKKKKVIKGWAMLCYDQIGVPIAGTMLKIWPYRDKPLSSWAKYEGQRIVKVEISYEL